MKRKILLSVAVALSLVVFALSAVLFTACSGEENPYEGWSLSETVTAKFSDNGKYGFILTVEGSGKMPDFASKKDAPWYGKSGRVTEIVISDKITSIGDNAFTECVAIKQVVLPASVTSVGTNAFAEGVKIYAYSAVTVEGSTVYLYSENAPQSSGNFWHYKNGIITEWDVTNKVTKVLFIGNSFTFYSDIPKLFENIAKAADKKVVVDSVTQGSWTLEKFADSNDEHGKRVDEKLNAANDYDAIVLQEQSTRPLTNYNSFLNGAKALQTKIEATQTNCSIYLYSTWGYKSEADAMKITIPEMESRLRKAYSDAAKEMGVKVCNVGAAFSRIYTEHPEFNLYWWDDNKHPSYLGAYLSACVHVATILNCDPRIADYVGHNDTALNAEDKDVKLDEATAKILRQVAYSVVFGA